MPIPAGPAQVSGNVHDRALDPELIAPSPTPYAPARRCPSPRNRRDIERRVRRRRPPEVAQPFDAEVRAVRGKRLAVVFGRGPPRSEAAGPAAEAGC